MKWGRAATVACVFAVVAGGAGAAPPPIDRTVVRLRFANLIHVSNRQVPLTGLRYFRPDKAWVNIADRYLAAVAIDGSGQWADALTADERQKFEQSFDWNRFSAVGAAITRKTPGYRLTIKKISLQRAGTQLCVVAKVDKPSRSANEPVSASVSLHIVRGRAFAAAAPERWVLRSTDGRLLAVSHGTGATAPSLCR